MDLAGVAPAGAACNAAPHPHAQARAELRAPRALSVATQTTPIVVVSLVDRPGIAPGSLACDASVFLLDDQPVERAGVAPAFRDCQPRVLLLDEHPDSVPGRNRTLFRGFGGHVAPCAPVRELEPCLARSSLSLRVATGSS